MPEQSSRTVASESQNTEENAGDRAAELNSNPNRSLEEARNAAEGKSPNASGGVAPSTAEETVPSNSDPDASDLPSSNTPTPD